MTVFGMEDFLSLEGFGLDRSIAARSDPGITVEYQPIVDLDKREVKLYEALSRVLGPDGRSLSVGPMLANATCSGLVKKVDQGCLAAVVKDLAFHPRLVVSINVAIESLVCRKWQDSLNKYIKEFPQISGRLFMELDENSTTRMPDFVGDFMFEYQAKGIRFTLDNFGKGNTSLRHFIKFHFDALKVDEYFTRGLEGDIDKALMTRIIFGITNEFDVGCIAEKVQTSEESKFLKKIGIHWQQGNVIAKPSFGSVLRAAKSPQFD